MICLSFCTLTACNVVPSNEGITYSGDKLDPELLTEPTDEELSFYPTIEEALKASEMSSDNVVGDKKVVKVVEKNNRCDVFFIITEDKRDGLYVYKLKEKVEGDQILYSESIFATGEQWRITKQWIREIAKRSDANEVLKQKVQSDLQSTNMHGFYNLGESGGQVRWGTYNGDDVKTLTINGEAPTEIMELTMDGEKAYFWYYENLEIPESEINLAKVEY